MIGNGNLRKGIIIAIITVLASGWVAREVWRDTTLYQIREDVALMKSWKAYDILDHEEMKVDCDDLELRVNVLEIEITRLTTLKQ